MIDKSTSLAVFDLDGTITTKDTFLEFIKYEKGDLQYYLGLAILSPFIIAYYLKLLPNYVLKEKFFNYYFKGVEASYLKEKGDKYSELEIPKITRSGAKTVLDWHQSQGHIILVLSASADIWLRKWCEVNQFKLICTRFEVKNNVYTGRLQGKNCFGEEKRIQLKHYLNGKNYNYIYGYGDSSADQYFLELVDDSYLMKLHKDNVKTFWEPNLKT